MIKLIPSGEMKNEFFRILKDIGFNSIKAEKCADIFTVNSLEGIYSHGVNRFPRFVKNVKDGIVIPDAEPWPVHSWGALEQWNGNLGPGPLNALMATDRACEIAGKNGIGLIAMANTNHWMRGGTYGREAAQKGFAFIGWTNTEANMPAWGAKDPRLGNNPLVIAVPAGEEPVVLDFAMTQYSYGKMESFSIEGKNTPYPGGYDHSGKLTQNPDEILMTRRALPIGYWKGSGLSLLLDILAAILSSGLSTREVTRLKYESSLSQVFIAVDIKNLPNSSSTGATIKAILDDLKNSVPADPDSPVRYPGESVPGNRKRNLEKGIPVNKKVWETILSL